MSEQECVRCEGSGLVWSPRPDAPEFMLAEDCPSCEGLGVRTTVRGATTNAKDTP